MNKLQRGQGWAAREFSMFLSDGLASLRQSSTLQVLSVSLSLSLSPHVGMFKLGKDWIFRIEVAVMNCKAIDFCILLDSFNTDNNNRGPKCHSFSFAIIDC